ncbi:dihydrolipoyl dehydrogenase [Candidatus Phytoplasma pini]|uniref:Dihydrolipoyl dehydrogenase n=1 Tax=Candidatus Phytoplasma pini TaxID=267362 RepID=A0A559KJJ0_9MOLU|nr:dihydrolipoyl dehydrogenase [Candidatus Phytoplasma pini]TVY12277.1 dihydrolipoamide dehydrogenase [Candidatus Phytoplasma pini]
MLKYDILVIGSGPGGYVAAIKASQLGAKVALIEDHKVGGMCLNYGCIPTKAYLKSAKIFHFLNNASNFGINASVTINFNWLSVLERKNKIVKQLINGINHLLKKNKIDVYHGFAEALTPHQIKVNEKILKTKKLIIATGASALIPPIQGVQEAYQKGTLYTSKEIVNLDKYPKKIIIIGGGVISVEFATIFNKFGSEVIIIEKQNSILNTMDKDIINTYTQKLIKNGIKIFTESQVNLVKDREVHYLYKNEQKQEKADIILLAIGNKPNLKGIEKLNLVTEKSGIVTDNFLKTSVEDVYAIGDVNGKFMLAHVATHEGIVAVFHALEQTLHLKPMNYDHIPSCIYGFPEIASIGFTEEQLKQKNISYKTFKFPVSAIGKALVDGETEGFAKIIVEQKNLKILGMHILAYNATDLISEIGLAMEFNATAYDVAHTIHPHPTLSELTLETVLGVIDKPIHI